MRCAVEFKNVKDMVAGLNKFRVIIQNEQDPRKGCIQSIVRIKNMFSDVVSWKDLSEHGYCDVKFNCIIKVGSSRMIVEIQFLLVRFFDFFCFCLCRISCERIILV